MAKQFRGILKAQEHKPVHSIRDLRSFPRRFLELLSSRAGGCLAIFMLMLLGLVFSYLADVILLMMIIVFCFSMGAARRLPFKQPIYEKGSDPNNSPPGSTKPGKSSGIYYFGNEINTDNEIWFNNDDMRTHCLVFGSTGSGKTETLLSLSYNALVQGSGFIYVDGKGDNALFAKVFALARSLGREDDLLVINFMTGAKDIIGAQKDVISNTLNPFAVGSSSMLSQLVISMMDSGGKGGGNDDMWKGRAISFIEALMRVLVYLRDQGAILLDANAIRRYFTIEALEGLYHDRKIFDEYGGEHIYDKDIPFDVKDALSNYLLSLPAYKMSAKGEQPEKVYEQHGYIIMQLTRIFGSLADVYAHIIRTNIAEVDFKDVILNRRILVVLLPALEKSPPELANLGKLIIASLKAMLAAGLGEKIEGDYKDVIETKPTTAKTPYLCILDEYGYYAVEGFAVVPAQARSLGFSVVFAGQDLPAFQKASKEEAASICANTNIKICMKLEDPQETWEFFNKMAGEAYVSVAKSYNINKDSTTMSYLDNMEATIEKRSRVDLMDLKDQREGEGHIFFKSEIIRMASFYANAPKVKRIKINQFLKVEPLNFIELRRLMLAMGLHACFENLDTEVAKEQAKDDAFAAKLHRISELDPFDIKHVVNFIGHNEDIEPYEQADNRIDDDVKEDVEFYSRNDVFYKIPLDRRVESRYFDMDAFSLEESLIDFDKIQLGLEKVGVLNGLPKRRVREIARNVAERLSAITEYRLIKPEIPLQDILDRMLDGGDE
ncbi:MAG: type IV secretory system conjugative DNA transfer family protein [Francisellaceae bacterium]